MTDFLSDSRQAMIENFQISLRAIRTLMGYSASELAEFVGVTRQTINNLETGKGKMSPTQYIAIAAVIDNYISSNGEMFTAIEKIIDSNGKKRTENYDSSFSNFSLLKRWFACFDDTSHIDLTFLSFGSPEEYSSLLQKIANRYKIFIDADVLMASYSAEFVKTLSSHIIAENAKIIIPLRVVEQIQQMLQDISFSEQAVKALKLINLLQRQNAIQFRGEESDTNIHDTILSVFAKFRSLYRLCLITQDESFAEEILRLNENSEKQGFDILVGYINSDGILSFYLKQNDSSIETDFEYSDISDNQDEVVHEQNESLETTIENETNLTGWEQL